MATSLGSVLEKPPTPSSHPGVDAVRIVVSEGASLRPHGPIPAPAVPSDDDPDLEDTGPAGASVVEQLLGGQVIDVEHERG